MGAKLLLFGNDAADQRALLLGSLPRALVWEAKGGKALSPGHLQKPQQLHFAIYTQ
ncbi:hypothetical protein KSB_46030 [Ktedonobacter robiniae]|uniref:Uncharacterized protein n=1 Tax=Ktedonobacter robiniae TaxID=2778365 RepID=A0ABQ3UTN3_9CHLR|nr:hypothetical protein KSB_46030 [Ktedonobacter robiniae]